MALGVKQWLMHARVHSCLLPRVSDDLKGRGWLRPGTTVLGCVGTSWKVMMPTDDTQARLQWCNTGRGMQQVVGISAGQRSAVSSHGPSQWQHI